MSYLNMTDPSLGLFDPVEVTTKGKELTSQYNSAVPFPHIAIDDFLPNEVLDLCLERFPTELDPESETFDRPQERYKSSYNPDYLEPQGAARLRFSGCHRPCDCGALI